MGSGHLKMGDLTKACGVSDQAVRLYERMGLLKPVGKTAKGYRLYDAASVETLRFIKQAQRSGFILEEIKVLLHTDIRDERACASMKALLDQKIHALVERLLELQGVKNVLQSLRQACDGEPGPLCPAFLKLCVPQRAIPEAFEPALGCRTYVVNGHRKGLPDAAWVVEALRKAQETEAHACCTPMAKPKASASCPACGMEGNPVRPVTLRALLQLHLRSTVQDEVYRFCANSDCALVYFSADGAQTWACADLTVRVGMKEQSAPRPLCYCFGHSAESIREEWARTGKSTVLEAIKAEVKAGTCRCEVTNPGGGCCLGDITKEVKALTAAPATPTPLHDFCASSKPSCC